MENRMVIRIAIAINININKDKDTTGYNHDEY